MLIREAAHTELNKHIAALQGKQGQVLVDAFCAAAQQRSDCGSFKAGPSLFALYSANFNSFSKAVSDVPGAQLAFVLLPFRR